MYSPALKHTLDEMQKVCPDIKNAFVLAQNHELIAKDENTPQKTITRVMDIFDEMLEKAEAIGGIEDLIIECTNGRVNVSHMDEIYLVTVNSKKADPSYVHTVTHVLVPIVLRLLEKLNPAPLNKSPPRIEAEPEEPDIERAEETVTQNVEELQMAKSEERAESAEKSEDTLPEPPVSQFIVEDLKGLLAPSDIVRVDNKVIEQWYELFEDRIIEEVDIETFTGKSIRCKVKPIKDSKLDGQGKIQIPGKVQLELQSRKGELVRVKPVIE